MVLEGGTKLIGTDRAVYVGRKHWHVGLNRRICLYENILAVFRVFAWKILETCSLPLFLCILFMLNSYGVHISLSCDIARPWNGCLK